MISSKPYISGLGTEKKSFFTVHLRWKTPRKSVYTLHSPDIKQSFQGSFELSSAISCSLTCPPPVHPNSSTSSSSSSLSPSPPPSSPSSSYILRIPGTTKSQQTEIEGKSCRRPRVARWGRGKGFLRSTVRERAKSESYARRKKTVSVTPSPQI